MKYFLFLLTCLMICKISFSQHELSEPVSKEQTQKDEQGYVAFIKKKATYKEMQEC